MVSLSGGRLLLAVSVIFGLLSLLVADGAGEWLGMMGVLYGTFVLLYALLWASAGSSRRR